MGHSVVYCKDCGSPIMEGSNGGLHEWNCDECGWGVNEIGEESKIKSRIRCQGDGLTKEEIDDLFKDGPIL
jgi:ribosomal protein L37AE/L43A